MRKYIKIGIALFLISVLVYLGYNINANLKHKREVAERIKTIPKFNFKTLNGENFTQNNISKTLPKLFIYFNSECEFCNGEAQKLKDNISNFKNVQLLFVSHEEMDNITAFAKKYQLLNKDNIVFLQDSKLEFSVIFDAKTLPFMLLYSKDNNLIKKFKGSTNPKKILTYLSK